MIFPSFIMPLVAYSQSALPQVGIATLQASNLRWMILKCDRFRTVTVQSTVCHTILFEKLDFVWPWSQTTDWRFYELAVLRVASRSVIPATSPKISVFLWMCTDIVLLIISAQFSSLKQNVAVQLSIQFASSGTCMQSDWG